MFIGRSVGDTGIAAINIAWPLVAIILAMGTGIGMGGAIHISALAGAKENKEIPKTMGNGVAPLLRNQGKAWMAMILMISNFVIDTLLSGIFVMVLRYRFVGAAWATLIGQSFALIPSIYITKKRQSSNSFFLHSRF